MDESLKIPLLTIAIPVAVIGLLAIVVWYNRKLERERRQALERLAQTLRCAFLPEGDAALLGLCELALGVRHKRSAKVRNVLRGERHGIPFRIVDYSYVTHSGKHSHHHRQTVVAAELGRPLPDFQMRRETWIDKLGDYVGWHDLDFDHRPGFSSTYFLRGKNESEIRAFFGDRALGLLENRPEPLYALGGVGDVLVIQEKREFLPPEELESHLEAALEIAAAFRTR